MSIQAKVAEHYGVDEEDLIAVVVYTNGSKNWSDVHVYGSPQVARMLAAKQQASSSTTMSFDNLSEVPLGGRVGDASEYNLKGKIVFVPR